MHLFDVDRRFFGGNAIVAGGIPLAVGLALADHMRGDDRVTESTELWTFVRHGTGPGW